MENKVTKEDLEILLPEWEISECDGSFEASTHSPEGEEVILCLGGGSLKEMGEMARTEWEGFDPCDHAAVIYHEKHYGSDSQREFYASAPSNLRDLIDDAEWIAKAYQDAYSSLCGHSVIQSERGGA